MTVWDDLIHNDTLKAIQTLFFCVCGNYSAHGDTGHARVQNGLSTDGTYPNVLPPSQNQVAPPLGKPGFKKYFLPPGRNKVTRSLNNSQHCTC